MMSEAPTQVTVEVVSDAICPWCWIGKRHLEQAEDILAGQFAVRKVWKPFELNPDMPEAGVARKVYRQRKFGSLDFSEQLDAQVREKGRAAGLEFRHDLMEWTPNTVDCHRLIWFSGQEGRQNDVVERLFSAYFNEGRNIGDWDIMTQLASEAGLNRDRVRALLESGEGAKEVSAELAKAREMGISGVPTFMVDGQPLMSGAAPPQLLASTIAEAATRRLA